MGSGEPLSSLLEGGEMAARESLECARPCVTNPRRIKVNTRLEFRGSEHVRADRRAEGKSFSSEWFPPRFTTDGSPSTPETVWRISPRFSTSHRALSCETSPNHRQITKGVRFLSERGARHARKNSREQTDGHCSRGLRLLNVSACEPSVISSRRNGNLTRKVTAICQN